MLIVLPVCRKDAHLALASLRLVAKLDPDGVPFPLLITTERGFAVKPIVEAAKPLFASVKTHIYDPCPYGPEFPKPQNHAWQQSARAVAGIPNTRAWLWWEPDAVPTCPGWATLLWDAYQAGRKPAGGAVVRKGSNGRSYVAGVAVYPANAAVRYENAMMTREAPFDIVASIMDGLLAQATDLSPLITHDYRADGTGRTWSSCDQVPEGVALWHRCDDASLQALLMCEERGARTVAVPPAKVLSDLPTIVQLGRLGDIMNVLPVARAISQGNQQVPVPFVVHASMLPAVQRTKYVKPIVWQGSLEDPQAAAAGRPGRVLVPQFFSRQGLRLLDQVRPYNVQQYEVLGWAGQFGELPLEFDARDFAEEAKLMQKVPTGPYVVANLSGYSSPLNCARALYDGMQSAGIPVVDVSGWRLTAMADMLGVLDNAAAILTADTALLHLANASCAPLIALTSDAEPWKRTAPIRKRHMDVPYQQVQVDEIVRTLHTFCACWTPAQGRFVHVLPRRQEARVTECVTGFERLYLTGRVRPAHVWYTSRNANALLGDRRALPFLKDVLARGLCGAESDEVLLFTNDDVWLHEVALDMILRRLCYTPLVTCHRADIAPDAPFGTRAPSSHHAGRDLFACRVGWLRKHWDDMPDFLLGASEWDIVLAAWARKLAGATLSFDNVWLQHPVCELPHGVLEHRTHEETWNRQDNVNSAPSQIHNRLLSHAWFRTNTGFIPHWKITR